MRPLELDLEGFGVFRERTAVDFADAELFAIVGATGHGKSTLIDAICFALYGKVPRHGERDIAPVVTLGSNEAKVAFTFELAGRTYRAARVLRRDPNGPGAKTKAVRLELVGADGSVEVLAGSVREFQHEIQRLVGLDFDQFTKCVVLPQGRFAEFLHAPAGDRTAILSALLDLGRYDRMAGRAREHAKESAGRRAVLEQERARLGETTPASVAAARARHTELVAALADVEAAAPADVALTAAIAEAEAAVGAARRVLVALDTIRVPATIPDLARTVDDASVRVEAATDAADAADIEASKLEAERGLLPDIAAVATQVELRREYEDLGERITKGTTVLDERAGVAATTRAALAAAQAENERSQLALDDVQRTHAHADLRRELTIGAPCPVCEQVVTAVPVRVSTTAVAKARTALDARRAVLQKAETADTSAQSELHEAEVLLAQRRERQAELGARIDLATDVAALETEIGRVQRVHAEAAEARTHATELRKPARAAAEALAALGAAVRDAEGELQTRRDALVSVGVDPPGGSTESDLAERWGGLAQWAADTRPDYEKRAAAAEDAARAHAAERDALFGDLATRAGLATPSTFAQLLAGVTAAGRDAEHASADAQKQLERTEELDTTIAEERGREQVAADLGRLLDKRHFGQWLVDEALHGLVTGASDLLERLSAGQYALAAVADGELVVVDHVNADETRSVRSLSGGETFQASLALALALAEHIAELASDGAASLESIFLDEGFGTLDPETLDVVASTIESLGHGTRVVGIVTHVPELAERLPTRFRVRKQGRTAVVTREDA
ncbi:MAG: SMC family ATPase [Actinomycetota bacterium]|nr:SMC family ATPase [Actinomycetota bacterium]